jgi:hypothetical protein
MSAGNAVTLALSHVEFYQRLFLVLLTLLNITLENPKIQNRQDNGEGCADLN